MRRMFQSKQGELKMLYKAINDELRNAIRNKDNNIKNYTRGIKAKVSEYCVANMIEREDPTDDVVLIVIMAHKKSLEKAIEMLGNVERAKDLIEEYNGEIKFCNKFLPDEKDVIEKVTKIIDEIVATNDPNQSGKIIGLVIKSCKEKGFVVDGALVKKMVIEKLPVK